MIQIFTIETEQKIIPEEILIKFMDTKGRNKIITVNEITTERIKEFVKGHYYCDEECTSLWEPFEDEEESTIKEYIDNDVYALAHFLKENNRGK